MTIFVLTVHVDPGHVVVKCEVYLLKDHCTQSGYLNVHKFTRLKDIEGATVMQL
ncbi:hypothetical protein CHS0354_041572, partial [Potamilus streckersoni]